MGSFFTNIQVFRPTEKGAPVSKADVVAALTSALEPDGYIRARGRARADREILLSTRPRWLSVFDEGSDSQDTETLERLAQQLSAAAGTVALAVLVHDGSVLHLTLFDAGELRDRYISHPDYFETIANTRGPTPLTNPSAWRPLLVPPATIDDLQAVLADAQDAVFAEDILDRLNPLLGLSASQAGTSHKYLSEAGRRQGITGLRFLQAAIPERFTGPPRLGVVIGGFRGGAWTGGTYRVRAATEFQFELWVANSGGAGRGLTVTAQIDGVGDLTPKEVILSRTYGSTDPYGARLAFTKETRVGRPIWVAKAEDFDLHAGIVVRSMADALSGRAPVDPDSQFAIDVRLWAARQGPLVLKLEIRTDDPSSEPLKQTYKLQVE